jgi:hypothetical protein
MLRAIESLLKLPATERNAKIKRGLRNRSQRYLAKAIYSSLGYWLNRTNSRYILEFRPDSHHDFNWPSDYGPLLECWLAGNRHENGGDLGRFYTLCLNINQVLGDGIPGDFVEIGVYKGNSASLLAAFARRHKRSVFLFDTFGGFDERDLHGVDGEQPIQFTDTSLAGVQRLVGTEGVNYVQGFFPESARITNIAMPQAVAVAHIDCDLYAPMKAGLEWLYPRLSPGGIMLLHDYSSGNWPGATQAIDEFFKYFRTSRYWRQTSAEQRLCARQACFSLASS